MQGRLISFFFRRISVCAVVAFALGGQNEQASAQPFLTIYSGPGFDGTTGYFNPSFHQGDGTARPEASWALLNNAGTVAW